MTARPAAEGVPALLDRLRAETRAAHEDMERVLDWERRVSTVAGYRGLLARLYGFHMRWEPEAAALIADPAWFDPRRRAPLLVADLGHLGLTPGDIAGLPVHAGLGMQSRSDALGAMYVLEGSTLGGQLIARHVARTLGFTAGAGCSFYGGRGQQAGVMWRAFCGRLADPDLAAEAAIRTALQTFAALRLWLTTTGA